MTQIAPHSGRPQVDPRRLPPESGTPLDDDETGEYGRGRHATPQGQGFGRIVIWTILGSLLPGSGLIVAGRRSAGRAILTVSVLLLLVALVVARFTHPMTIAMNLVSDPNRFVYVALGLAALVVLWAAIVIGTHASLRRYGQLTSSQRVLSALLVAALIGIIALPTAKAGSYAMDARNALKAVFANGNQGIAGARKPNAAAPDPWANTPRINILLMGGDSGPDRVGIRPDTMILASINTHTGDTLLISLPRNLQHVPFPSGTPQAAQFPNGFYCYNAAAHANTECLLNALWTWADNNPQYYKGDKHPGITATMQAITQLTGLQVDDYVTLNLLGFRKFIDAIGGLTVNVRERLPVGGSVEHPVATSWLTPGVQKLNGYNALWYARSRWSTDDFDRMRRQRCVIGDVVQQANPVTIALHFSAIAAAMQQNLQTSIPLDDLTAWVTLAQRVKKSQVRSLAFTNSIIDTTNPDVPKMVRLVTKALTPPAKKPTPKASATTSPGSSGTGGTGKGSPSTKPSTRTPGNSSGSPTPTTPSVVEDVKTAC